MTGRMGLVVFFHQTGNYLPVRDSSGRLSPVSFCQPLTHWQKQLSFPCCLSVGAPNLAASPRSRMKCPIKRCDAGQVDTPVRSQLFARLHCVCVSVCFYLWIVLTATLSACMSSDSLRLHPSIHPSIYSSLLFNEMASLIKVHWLCADKPRFN